MNRCDWHILIEAPVQTEVTVVLALAALQVLLSDPYKNAVPLLHRIQWQSWAESGGSLPIGDLVRLS